MNKFGNAGEGSAVTSTTISPTSTGQFISSTGSCKMIGMNEQKRMIYVAENTNKLRDEIARGSGEYLKAYATLSGCSIHGTKELPKIFQKNYRYIYGVNSERQLVDIYESMDNLLKLDLTLSKDCHVQG